jgi:hypothetical protein
MGPQVATDKLAAVNQSHVGFEDLVDGFKLGVLLSQFSLDIV